MNMLAPARLATRLLMFGVVGLCALGGGYAANAAVQSADLLEQVRRADVRLATIGWRLATANAALCDRLEPGTGLQLHTLDQFDADNRAAARAHFGFATPVAIEGVVAGSPAEAAGLRADDSLVRVGNLDIAAIPGKPGTTDRLVAAQQAIASLAPSAPIEVDVLRGGAAVHATIQPVTACRSRFELLLVNGYNASADGSMVQISARFFDEYPEAQVVAAIAHEFSHNILHHRDRLEARGVDFGMLSGFGGNVKYFRQTELQADILSVYLLTNAGYDPAAGPGFWRSFGPSKAGASCAADRTRHGAIASRRSRRRSPRRGRSRRARSYRA
ncbi:peptidase M48 family protein [Sphingomonas sp. MMS12-HWE2-04]|uniref:peptidase M48 family protein n=1 Tax=Sphingomonas sp. MMS12-HWE2-04 TaxID=3234199 RepID=UPI003850E7D4